MCERREGAPADLEAIVVCAVLRAVRNQTDAKASSLRGWEGRVAINCDRKNQEGVLIWSIKIIFLKKHNQIKQAAEDLLKAAKLKASNPIATPFFIRCSV